MEYSPLFNKLSSNGFLKAMLVILGFPRVENLGETQNQVNCFVKKTDH